jgi:hypothetical protein
LSLSQHAGAGLASELFDEGNYTACRTECMRDLSADPHSENARLLKVLAELMIGMDSSDALASLADSEDNSMGIRARSNYELGRMLRKQDNEAEALKRLKWAFYNAESEDTFLQTGQAIDELLSENPDLCKNESSLKTQLALCALLWDHAEETNISEAAQESRNVLSPGFLISRPCQWMITFYRSQISPALGRRCSLYPSCSEYARQALAKHGILGMTIYADRAVREPDVVSQKKQPLIDDGVLKYVDVLDDHDWWMPAPDQAASERQQ